MEAEKSEKQEGEALATLLSVPLSTLDLSVRTSNVLKLANIVFVGDLVSWTEAGLMKLQNCGAKSVRELKMIVESYGLRLGTHFDWVPPEPAAFDNTTAPTPVRANKLSDFDDHTRAMLFLRIADLRLSVRADNILKVAHIEFVGELVRKTPAELRRLQSCGRLTIGEIEGRLESLGLSLDTEISDWDRKIAQAEYDAPKSDLDAALVQAQKTFMPDIQATCLEEELCGLISSVTDERNALMVTKLTGWSGGGRRTLESVGQEYGITRERVRQIAAKAINKIKRCRIETPWLTRATNAARQVGPVTPQELAKLLRKARISRTDFNPSGLESACEELDITFGLERAYLAGQILYGRASALSKLRALFRLCKKLTGARGCANFDAMCDELGIPESERDSARFLIAKNGINVWLDEEQRWLLTKTVTRNRLTNILSKVLFVAPTLNIGELRRAAAKSRRLHSVPPTKVLAMFLQTSGLATVTGDQVTATASFDGIIEPNSSEAIMLSVMKAHGPLMRWDRLHELCIAQGMNPTTASIYMSISPVISRVTRGVYSLVGAKIEAGVAEEIAAEIARTRRAAEHGWTSRGTLWCAIEVSRNALTSGSVNLPTFVTNMIEGKEWHIRFDNRFFGTQLKARNHFVWSLAKPLDRLGAEPGDICILEFDLIALTVDIKVGGEDMVDAWESGDIDIIEGGPLDVGEVEIEESDDDLGEEASEDAEAIPE